MTAAVSLVGAAGLWIALWFKPDFFYNFNTVFDNSVHADQREMRIYGDGRVRGRVNSDGSGDVEYDLDNLNGSNHWYHIAFVWDNVNTNLARLYVNGDVRSSGPIARRFGPGGTFHVGGGNAGNTRGRGTVDDVRVYAKPLTGAQIHALYAGEEGTGGRRERRIRGRGGL